MNCQEVMEYMQRQLDGDLDDQETEILMNHTRHCPNCAAMFSRLQMLSSGLENLPKVMPGYSLVDAIMPRLQELQTAVIAPENVQSAGEEEHASAINRREPRNRSAGWWKDRFSLRALGGVIAAGVVVGLFLVNYHPNNLMSSDKASGNESTMTADLSDSAETGSSTSSESAANTPKANNEVQTEVAESTSSDKALDKMSAADQSNSVETKSAIDPNGAPLMKHEYKASADTPIDKVASPNYEESETTVTDDSNTNGSANTDNKMNLDNSNQGFSSTNDNKTMMTDSAATHFATSELQATSQDGKYRAFVVDQMLKVYSADDNVLQFQSDSRPAGITSLQWSPDSKTITYETPAADGKSKLRYTVDIASASEQLQAH